MINGVVHAFGGDTGTESATGKVGCVGFVLVLPCFSWMSWRARGVVAHRVFILFVVVGEYASES